MKDSKFIKIWKYSLGSYADEKTEEYDTYITIVRSIILLLNLGCAIMIMANILHNWGVI